MKKLSFFVFLLLLSSCSGSGGSSDGSANAIEAKALSADVLDEVATLKEALKSDAKYNLEKSELDLLKSEGLLSESDYNELIALL